jgi:hypothetical protein
MCNYCQCDNYSRVYLVEDLAPQFPDIEELGERLDPGWMVPSGECPECYALCYPVEVVAPRPHVKAKAPLDYFDLRGRNAPHAGLKHLGGCRKFFNKLSGGPNTDSDRKALQCDAT